MDISNVFTETKCSRNEYKFLHSENPSEIVIGANSIQTIELPFIFSEAANNIVVIYKQGLDDTFVLSDKHFNLYEFTDVNKTIVEVKLTPEYTSLFKDTPLDTKCQCKVTLKNSSVYYSDAEKIKIINPLDSEIKN